MTIDSDTHEPTCLIRKDYTKIEKTIVNLYTEINVNKLPINPFEIAIQKGFILIPYSQAPHKARSILKEYEVSGSSGITKEGVYKIFYDDSHCIERQRFTIMHEIGHILLGHKEDSAYAERCANYFAAYSLAPPPIIAKFNCEDFMDIAIIFKLSQESASYAFIRYCNWIDHSFKLKPHEVQLLNLFNKN